MNIQAELVKSLYTGFIDNSGISHDEYRPKLLLNDWNNGQKVLTSIIKELKNCDEFFFSIAFITQSGVTTLLNTLKELEERNIRGKIVASQYLNFTDPAALLKLLRFRNIELRILTNGHLHSKGYIFRRQEMYSLIVGSSNMTQEALSSNKEWNIKVSSMAKGSLIQETLTEFEQTFQMAEEVDQEWIDAYNLIYQKSKQTKYSDNGIDPVNDESQAAEFMKVSNRPAPLYRIDHPVDSIPVVGYNTVQIPRIMPNKMQVNALIGIERVRQQGGTKALLISATGTGKTYLAAFDVRRVQPKRFLFLVHREQILDQAIESFKNVMGHHIDVGKLCGGERQLNARYLFSTIQTMSKDGVIKEFKPDAFDYIIIDESHRMGAETYQRILGYFTPEFLLGMTATPERTDGYNIFNDFNYNIAYEIRLQEAMKEDMLCPFHYFGISDLWVDGIQLDEISEFRYLVSDERVEHIIEKIKFYGYHGERVKGLIFCAQKEEARQLSQMFNKRGYSTLALTGEDSQELREESIERLEQNTWENRLDYIFTVDIFNEGVDIPKVNQIVMLRPTQSSIIFIQQLGRGLRKIVGKEYVVVLDFIGNYKNNFLIPIALSGDKTYNKDTVRRFVAEGSRVIPGCSTVNFDMISAKRIYESIDQVDSQRYAKIIYEGYQQLKYRLGRIPTLMDFELHDTIDIELIFKHKSYRSYYRFLVMKDKDEYKVRLTETEEKWIEFLSELAIGKRPHEMLVIRHLLKGSKQVLEDMKRDLMNDYGIQVEEKTYKNVVNVLTNVFPSGSGRNSFKECIFLELNGNDYGASKAFVELLKNTEVRVMVKDLVELGLYRYKQYYGQNYLGSSLQLYQKYSYMDVCRLLEWEHNEVPLNIGGYKYDKESKTFPVFINYQKEENVALTIRYEDRFESPTKLIALSKSKRTVDSNDIQIIYHAQDLGVNIELFVRKNKDDNTSKEFYYLGRMKAVGQPNPIKMVGAGVDAVEIGYQLFTPVREDIYEYITVG